MGQLNNISVLFNVSDILCCGDCAGGGGGEVPESRVGQYLLFTGTINSSNIIAIF